MMERGWKQLQHVYGLEDLGAILGLAVQGSALGICAAASFVFFQTVTIYLTRSLPFLPIQIWSLLVGFSGGLMALMSVCFLVTAANLWYCGLILKWKIAQRIVGMVEWGSVAQALDIGCGSGMLLNAVASQLMKERVGGCAVGVDLWLDGGSMPSTLRNSAMEGVHECVTCKTGDARSLPLHDHFDVVVSALALHKLGKEYGPRSVLAAVERLKGLQEIVRVLRPGGIAVIWDLVHAPEYAKNLEQLNMQDIYVSECFQAFMLQSHIVSFRKPTSSS